MPFKKQCEEIDMPEFKFTYNIYSGSGSARILQELCTSRYKYDTFSICSLNLPGYEINAS